MDRRRIAARAKRRIRSWVPLTAPSRHERGTPSLRASTTMTLASRRSAPRERRTARRARAAARSARALPRCNGVEAPLRTHRPLRPRAPSVSHATRDRGDRARAASRRFAVGGARSLPRDGERRAGRLRARHLGRQACAHRARPWPLRPHRCFPWLRFAVSLVGRTAQRSRRAALARRRRRARAPLTLLLPRARAAAERVRDTHLVGRGARRAFSTPRSRWCARSPCSRLPASGRRTSGTSRSWPRLGSPTRPPLVPRSSS